MDTAPETECDEIAHVAAEIRGTPMSFVSLVDRDREYRKAAVGSGGREGSRTGLFCEHAILEPDVFEVPDALGDPRFANNPNVAGGDLIRVHAGAPVVTSDGFAVGMLCVKDTAPRELTDAQRSALTVLAHQVAAQLELRRLRAQRTAPTAQTLCAPTGSGGGRSLKPPA